MKYGAEENDKMKTPPPTPIKWQGIRRLGCIGTPTVILLGHRTWFTANQAAMAHFGCESHEVEVTPYEGVEKTYEEWKAADHGQSDLCPCDGHPS
jgi:hypothetical protein